MGGNTFPKGLISSSCELVEVEACSLTHSLSLSLSLFLFLSVALSLSYPHTPRAKRACAQETCAWPRYDLPVARSLGFNSGMGVRDLAVTFCLSFVIEVVALRQERVTVLWLQSFLHRFLNPLSLLRLCKHRRNADPKSKTFSTRHSRRFKAHRAA